MNAEVLRDVPVLLVLDGVQAGVETRLMPGDIRVGRAIDCSIVLADPALHPSHFRITIGDPTGLAASRLEADGPIVLADGTRLAPGTGLALAGSQDFTAGGTRFRLEMPTGVANAIPLADQNTRGGRRGRMALAVCGVLGGFVAAAIMLMGNGTHVHQVAANAPSAPLTPSQIAPADAAAALREQLRLAGLDSVDTAVAADGAVIATGVVGTDQRRAWSETRQWFDTRYGTERVLIEHIDPAGGPPPLHIAAVWNGRDPYVVDDHATRLLTGASIGGGWSIVKIEDGTVTVRRGATIVALRY